MTVFSASLNKALTYYANGEEVKYLAIFKNFSSGFTKSESQALELAYDILNKPSNESYYKSKGVDIEAVKEEARAAVKRYINNRKQHA